MVCFGLWPPATALHVDVSVWAVEHAQLQLLQAGAACKPWWHCIMALVDDTHTHTLPTH
jgi:hypothetical protein